MRYILFFFFISFNTYSQEVLNYNEVYSEKNLTYRIDNNMPFTGKIQKLKKKNHVIFEVDFENGILFKNTTYYNGEEKIVADEKFYNSERRIIKHVKYSSYKTYSWVVYFEPNGDKKLEENYSNGKLVYKCEYLNNRKNGASFSINKQGELKECFWQDGKLIK